jgi:NADH-quinone oxidoreductase subunit C
MNQKLERLQLLLKDLLGDRITGLACAFNELTIEISAESYHAVMMQLHDNPALCFEQLIDLSGIDYSEFCRT